MNDVSDVCLRLEVYLQQKDLFLLLIPVAKLEIRCRLLVEHQVGLIINYCSSPLQTRRISLDSFFNYNCYCLDYIIDQYSSGVLGFFGAFG